MTTSGPHALDDQLHPRLTVALVGPGQAGELGERLTRAQATVVDQGFLRRLADDVAQTNAPSRIAAANALQTTASGIEHDLQQAMGRTEDLRRTHETASEGVEWAESMSSDLPGLRADVERAREALDEAEAEQRQARAALERVLEQSAAAGAAMEEANRELADLNVAGMDESHLRRELEASGEAVRKAQEAHEAAAQRLAELEAEREAAEERLAAFEAALAAHAATAVVEPDTVAAVQKAYDVWLAACQSTEPDQFAQDLAQALTELYADLEQLQAGEQTVDPAAIQAAEERVAAATQAVEALRVTAAPEEMDADARAELDAVHEEVLAAEERAGRRIGGAAARKQLDAARAKEQELLDRFGFASYIDVVLTGGRHSAQDPRLLAAEHELRGARDALASMRAAASRVSPERAYLDAEHARLRGEAAKVLGGEPGPDVVERLRQHRQVDPVAGAALRGALDAAGVDRAGRSDSEAAVTWLATQAELAEEHDRWLTAADEVNREVLGLRTRLTQLEQEIPAAASAAAAAAEGLEMSARSVGAFEAELSVRADEDAKRLKRLAAAEQLRAQVEAMSATLAKAESAARDALDAASLRVTEAERALGQAQAALTEAADRGRRLARLLPADQTPAGDILDSLPALAEGLRSAADAALGALAEAEQVERELSGALEQARSAAESAQSSAQQAIDSDWVDGLVGLVTTEDRRVVVLDRALDELGDGLRHELLGILADDRATAPVVLLTGRADTVGWAIELSETTGTVGSVDAVLNSVGGTADNSPASDTTTTKDPARPAGRR